MYCGVCLIHRAGRDSPRLRAAIAEKHHCLPGEVTCDGCQSLHARGWSKDPYWGRNCRIRECLAKKELKFCHECAILDKCRGWEQLADSYVFLGLDLKHNLEMMRQGKTREWLAEQDAKWRCVHCHAPVIVSTEVAECHHCGKSPRGD